MGVDLAADPAQTGVAIITWRRDGAEVTHLSAGAHAGDGGATDARSDRRIVQLAAQASMIGIDCPFGWPDAFKRFLAGDEDPLGSRGTGPGGGGLEPGGSGWRRRLRYRRTEFVVRERAGMWPLSVTSSWMAITAMRGSALLGSLEGAGSVVDPAGYGDVIEVYPAAALKTWGLPCRGYKGAEGRQTRSGLLDALLAPGKAPWLDLGEFEGLCRDSDDALDAVVCALVAGARLAGRWLEAGAERAPGWPDADRGMASREGWIVLPEVGLRDLPAAVANSSGGR